MPNKQNYKAINDWKRANIYAFRIEAKKSDHLAERIQLAIDAGKSTSRQSYIRDAIREKLERDGIPILEDASAPEEEI